MSWHPQYHSSKFRHVYGKAASKDKCYDCVPITHNVNDNHFCAVNPSFIAVVTECVGGGAFLVIPIKQTGKLDPHYPKVCGHKGNVLDIKWNPFNDFVIASCSEDATNDLSVPLLEEDLDGSSGLLFPFYDSDTHMLYLVGKGDGNIRYYEISPKKPYLNYLMEYHSHLPQKGVGMMPKRGLDVAACEIFRFYKLIPTKSLIEPISMIVPRRSESYQADIYPMTAAGQPALTAEEWLTGINKGPLLVSLRPDSEGAKSLPQFLEPESPMEATALSQQEEAQGRMSLEDQQMPGEIESSRKRQKVDESLPENEQMCLSNGFDIFEYPPPKTENELLQMYYRQQEEIRRLRELIIQRDIQIKQLTLQLKNLCIDTDNK